MPYLYDLHVIHYIISYDGHSTSRCFVGSNCHGSSLSIDLRSGDREQGDVYVYFPLSNEALVTKGQWYYNAEVVLSEGRRIDARLFTDLIMSRTYDAKSYGGPSPWFDGWCALCYSLAYLPTLTFSNHDAQIFCRRQN